MKTLSLALLAMLSVSSSSLLAATYNLSIDDKAVNFSGKSALGMAVNDQIPGPLLRFKEGEEVILNVTNNMSVDSSIHWHGLILPYQMDGVPGISFDGIKPGATFNYKFTVKQNGTYWYHSHSDLQEQSGVYGPIIIEPKNDYPQAFDREYIVMLSDWTDEDPLQVLKNLKAESDYYKQNKRTVFDLFSELFDADGVDEKKAVMKERAGWAKMRMDPSDVSDVTGYRFLLNGKTAEQGTRFEFKQGERVRLRFINAGTSTYFDVKIPGLKMQLVQTDGQNIKPIWVDEIPMAIAETYDVIIEPKADTAYTIFAQAKDRSGYVSAVLSANATLVADIPVLSPRPEMKLKDVMGAMPNMAMPNMTMDNKSSMDMSSTSPPKTPMSMKQPMDDGRKQMEKEGWKVFSYQDLRSLEQTSDNATPDREILLRLTGNMERYFWSINDLKYSMAEPIKFKFGERVRVIFKNETMMDHPMHLHGMWQELDNGSGDYKPRKHTINIKPGETVVVEVPVDAIGEWAFHCHILYHADTGMFRKVVVEG